MSRLVKDVHAALLAGKSFAECWAYMNRPGKGLFLAACQQQAKSVSVDTLVKRLPDLNEVEPVELEAQLQVLVGIAREQYGLEVRG